MAMKMKRWKPRPGEEELLQKVHLAGQQIDSAEGGRLGWVVQFVNEDPKTWLPGDRESHGYRLLALVFRLSGNVVGLVGSKIGVLLPREVLRFHAELQSFVNDLVNSPVGIDVPTEGLNTCLVRASAVGQKPSIFAFGRGGPFRTLLYQAIAELVRDTDRLIACPNCGKPFLALRKKKFCTPKCAQQWHDREKIKKKQIGIANKGGKDAEKR